MISVLLPTYNQAEFLPLAIEGLELQTYRDFEVIACDDASTDSTPDLLGNASIRSVTHAINAGTAAAINTARRLARGEFITWISSDNVMTSDWLGTLAGAMAEDVGAVYSAFWYERPGEKPLKLFTPYHPETQINQEACYFGPSFLIRSQIWDEAGEHWGRISHDLAHWLRIEEVCQSSGLKIVGLDVPLCHYNAHDKRVTVTRAHEYDSPKRLEQARKRRCNHSPSIS